MKSVRDDRRQQQQTVLSTSQQRIRPNFANDVYGVDESIKQQYPSSSHMHSEMNSGTVFEMCESALAQRRSAQLPKLKEISNKPRFESNDFMNRGEMMDLDFVYTDCDTHAAELAELYTYSEIEDWATNVHSFRNYAEAKRIETVWSSLSTNQQKAIFFDLIERLESVETDVRLDSARIILYILQGAYLDFIDEQNINIDDAFNVDKAREPVDFGTGGYEEKCLSEGIINAYKAYEAGVFQALCTALMTELDDPWDVAASGEPRASQCSSLSNSRSTSNADLTDSVDRRVRKSATMTDNESLRVVLNAIYHMVESIRRKDLFDFVIPSDKKNYCAELRQNFITEIEEPIENVGTSLIMVLFEMMPPFCQGTSPHFPMKKVLLLTWKILLTILGGWKDLREAKASRRAAENLPPVEDTLMVVSVMKASSINGADSDQNPALMRPKRPLHSPARLIYRQLACTESPESSFKEDDEDEMKVDILEQVSVLADIDIATQPNDELSTDTTTKAEKTVTPPRYELSSHDISTSMPNSFKRSNPLMSSLSCGDRTPVAGTPPPMEILFRASLPWRPKVREEDIEVFLQAERVKFFDYQLPGDVSTVFGLPFPIQSSVEALRRHLYVSLCDLQVKQEKNLNRYLFSQREVINENATERLYRLMLPNFSQYIIALLKVLLAAAPSSKAKSDAINILSDLLTPETDNNEILSNSINFESSLTNVLEHSVRIAIDINRHKEIMVKAASSILILLLKHFRLNHVYQFEHLGQHLVFANSIPLILKFLDQNMVRYVQSKHELHPFNYPRAPLYFVRNREEWPVLNMDNVEDIASQSQSYYLWRNVFSIINLLRVLNKLTKWKHSRTMMLVVFKSAPMLKRSLRVKLAIFQLYVLKLLKMQARYLGRQWRRSNMEIMSAIYSKVRHRLNDDWAYANEARSKSWDFQNEEAILKAAVEKFNSRRYSHLYSVFALEPGESPLPGENYLDTTDLREYEPVDNSYQSVLGNNRDLSERFKRNYEQWVEVEVIKRHTDWDQLLIDSRGFIDVE